jgi:plasmid maintenance system antidote protein VapI
MSVVKDNAGSILKDYLKEHGLKQGFVARKMGMSDQNFSAHINGRLKFTADFAIAVARALDISADIFLK